MSGATTLAGLHYRYEPGAAEAPGSGWTLLLLHGTGGDEHQLAPLGAQLLPGAARLAPRGPVLEQGAPRFFARTALNQFDQGQVAEGVDALAGFVRAAQQEHAIAADRIVALGYSNGANAALAMMQRHPQIIAGAVLLRAMLVLDPPPAGDPLAGTALLALGGARDPFLPGDGYDRLVQVTTDAGAAVTAHVEPGVGHELGPGDVQAAGAWLAQLTSPAEA